MNKLFWKTYWSDKGRFAYMLIVMMIVFGIWSLITRQIQWPFILAYILVDPFSYYIISYKKQRQKQNEIDKLKSKVIRKKLKELSEK